MKKKKRVCVQYYALMREQRGCGKETMVTTVKTVLELYNQLKEQFKFTLSNDLLKVAINDEFKNWDTELNDNDIVVFIPPVAGG